MPGINAKNTNPFGGIPATSYKSRSELAALLGTHPQTVTAVKSGQRGLSVEVAKSVATKSGETPATLYAKSQAASMKGKIDAGKMSPSGALSAVRDVTASLRGKFSAKEIDRSDPEFQRALLAIREIAQSALDSGGNPEPVNSAGDSVEAALKTGTKSSTRDVHGRKIPDGERVERDGHGRAIR